MYIRDRTDTTLTLIDDQRDKAIALRILAVLVASATVIAAWNGAWIGMAAGVAALGAILWYSSKGRITSVLTIDTLSKSITLRIRHRDGEERWDWPLAELRTAELSTVGKGGGTSGRDRPVLVMQDDTRVPIRPYHSAGTQSWHAVAAVRLFIGQDIDDAPKGWIPPEEFDRFFPIEMARFARRTR